MSPESVLQYLQELQGVLSPAIKLSLASMVRFDTHPGVYTSDAMPAPVRNLPVTSANEHKEQARQISANEWMQTSEITFS
jgi:hypothetical protein